MTVFYSKHKPFHEFPPAGKCVDCGCTCSTYRCDKCYAKHIKGADFSGYDPDESYGDLDEIFRRFKHRRLH